MVVFDRDLVFEFSKDLKKVSRKVNLEEDLMRFEKAFSVDKIKLTGVFRIQGLDKKGVVVPIFKVKKFRCKALGKGSRSGIRIIFTYDVDADKFTYIEIYNKNKQTNHSEKRILDYFKN